MVEWNSDEEGFLRAIAEQPEDRSRVQIYADWLDERGDARGEFLRLWEKLAENTLLRDTTDASTRDGYRLQIRATREVRRLFKKLEEIRSTIDWAWVARIDRVLIRGCEPTFEFECPKKWESLRATDDPSKRFCEICQKNVYYISNPSQTSRHLLKGACVAISTLSPLGVLQDRSDHIRHVRMGRRPPPRGSRKQVHD